MTIDRRTFLQSAAALALTGCTRFRSANANDPEPAPAGGPRLPLAFSTLGCPGWDWQRILEFAPANGFSSIELRGVGTEMDLPRVPVFAPERIAATRREIADHRLTVSDLGSSTNLHAMEPVRHEGELAHARRFIDLASGLGVPYVRVFGNKYVAGVSRDTMLDHIAAGLRALGDYAGPRNVDVLLETHGDFTDSPTLLDLMRRTASPHAALLWDAHHTYAFGHEQPEATFAAIGSYVRHVHLKDSVPEGNDRRYVLTGTGEVPVARQVATLVNGRYRGVYCFEWEKRWHPEIPEPEIAFPQFSRTVTRYLAEAGFAAAGR